MRSVAVRRFNAALRTVLITMCACAALSVQALSIGEITVSSAVGERFYGVVKIDGARATDASQILVSIAPRSVYQRMGVAWDYFHSRLIFDVLSDENNSLYLRIVSSDIVYEPYLDFVISLRWPSGFISKQYTVLLDMPQQLQQASQTAGERLQPVAELQLPSADAAQSDVVVSPLPPAVSAPSSTPAVAPAVDKVPSAEKTVVVEPEPVTAKEPANSSTTTEAAKSNPSAKPQKEPTVADTASEKQPEQPEQKTVAEPVVEAAPKPVVVKKAKPVQVETEAGSDDQKVWKVATQRGDTLWAIARSIRKESGGSTLDILEALHKNNPRAFIGGNIDKLRADARLSVSAAQIRLATPEALQGELRPVEAKTSNTAAVKDSNNDAKATANVAAKDSQNGVLSLVAEESDAEVSEAVASLSQSLEENSAEFDRQLEKNKAQTEKIEASMDNLLEQYDALSEKTSQLKELETELNRSIAEKAQIEMGLAQVPATALPGATENRAQPEAFDPAEFAKTVVMWVIALGVIGLFAALVIYVMRRWQYQRWEAEDAQWDNDVFMQGNQFEGDDRAAPVELKGETVFIRPAEDPNMASHIDIDLAAADGSVELQAGLYIAYQRYEDAEQLLNAALEYQTDNLALKSQLLEVYAGTEDSSRFEALASELAALNDPQLNNKIKALRG